MGDWLAGAWGVRLCHGKPNSGPHTHPCPQNVWRNPSLRGDWAQGGGGVLAAEERALLDAYGSKK